MEKNSIRQGTSQQTAKAKQSTGKTAEKQASHRIPNVLALLEVASSATVGQLAGEELLAAAGSWGNQRLLTALESRAEEPAGLRETAAIMDGAVVPAFDPEAPASVIHPEEAFSPAAVPQFEFFGNQPAGFETILDLAVGSGGTAP
jgi:hypothetical protein